LIGTFSSKAQPMAMIRRLVLAGGLAVLASASLFSQAAPAAPKPSPDTSPVPGIATDRKEIIRQARGSYYSLKAKGLVEFRCQVLPDWDSISKDLPFDAAGRDQLLPFLKKVHFQVVVGPEVALTVSREPTDVPPNEEVANRLQRTASDLESVLKGFLNEWSLFAFTPPFPEIDGDYQLQEIDGKYHLAYKHGSGDVSTTMNHSFAIEELNFSSANVTGSILPVLAESTSGFVLAGYNATYLGDEGSSLQVSVTIDNQEVEGIKLPGTVKATIPSQAGRVTLPFTFADYQVKKADSSESRQQH
jgi:hypothetical protein